MTRAFAPGAAREIAYAARNRCIACQEACEPKRGGGHCGQCVQAYQDWIRKRRGQSWGANACGRRRSSRSTRAAGAGNGSLAN
jgi:hypothetical protein